MDSTDLPNAAWAKSSYSANGGNCVEVAVVSSTENTTAVAVRDSKDPEGAVLLFTPAQWREFTSSMKLDKPGPS